MNFWVLNKNMNIIDGKKIAAEVLAEVKDGVARLSFEPVFCDVLVGDDFASKKYVEMKAKKAQSVGIKFYHADFPLSVTTDELVTAISKLNKVPYMCGIIVQLPLPAHLDEARVLAAIDPELDVDALGWVTNEKFYKSESALKLPTALACTRILDSLGIDLEHKHIVVLGQGKLVGKPVTKLLTERGLTPIPVKSDTPNQIEILQKADVVISGIGHGNYIKGDMVKDGVVLIDAGTSESGAGLVGDVDMDSVKDKATYLSPCPGGVGPVTVAMLLANVLQVAQQKHNA
ncbi:MAG: bifunctional 5,10-methylenetetrahydrofolate dehydrogenase/5,10-methenyltetrahydrofolate cyclohydrolase [Candidatus Paceibacterota bacterium]